MVKTIFIITILLFSFCFAKPHLDNYIEEALQNNLALRQQNFSYEKSMAALNEAKGLFLPSLNIEARYSRAGGGRTIYFPIGDIVNPIYQSLNYLMGIPAFPINVPNETIPFLREKEHETKIRVIQPVIHPQIYYNYKIQKYLNKLEDASRRAYARQLISDVKTAYFKYLTSIKILELVNKTKILLQENVRVSESLYNNNKVTIDVIYRARAELSKIEQQCAEAAKLNKLSMSYFNFLLNRSLDNKIDVEDYVIPEERIITNLEETERHGCQFREEITQLRAAIDAQRNGVRLNKSSFLPTLSVVFDWGYQGEEYKFGQDDDYWMASGLLQWNLFNGFQDRAKIQQAELEQRRLELRLEELEKQIQLDVRTAYENLHVVEESIDAAREELNSAEKSFEIVNKKWEQGMVPHIEFIDAQTTFTRAELNTIIVNYDYFIKSAELEKAAATYVIPENK